MMPWETTGYSAWGLQCSEVTTAPWELLKDRAWGGLEGLHPVCFAWLASVICGRRQAVIDL